MKQDGVDSGLYSGISNAQEPVGAGKSVDSRPDPKI